MKSGDDGAAVATRYRQPWRLSGTQVIQVTEEKQ